MGRTTPEDRPGRPGSTRRLGLSYSYTFERNHTWDTAPLPGSNFVFDLVININATPWAEVFIEGNAQSLGQTPLTSVNIPVGASLVFRNPRHCRARRSGRRIATGDSQKNRRHKAGGGQDFRGNSGISSDQ